MKFKDIFNVYSRRPRSAKTALPPVTATLRNRILMLLHDVFSGARTYGISTPPKREYYEHFWSEIHYFLKYRHGRPMLVPSDSYSSDAEDVLNFLAKCNDDEFLDFIELIFKTHTIAIVCKDENLLVDEFNELMQFEDCGYELTRIVKRSDVPDNIEYVVNYGYTKPGRDPRSIVLVYPQVILKEGQVAHTEILKPVLNLLSDVRFANANKEYLEALDDYRKADYRDCLTMCCSAFESVMKIICAQKNWGCDAYDTADKLIQVIASNAKLASYFVQPLTLIATLRNKLSKSHGAGLQSKDVPQHVARYALNATASAIILLADATK